MVRRPSKKLQPSLQGSSIRKLFDETNRVINNFTLGDRGNLGELVANARAAVEQAPGHPHPIDLYIIAGYEKFCAALVRTALGKDTDLAAAQADFAGAFLRYVDDVPKSHLPEIERLTREALTALEPSAKRITASAQAGRKNNA